MGSGLLSPGHLLVVLIVALIVLGPKRLPEVGQALGTGLRGFKESIEGDGGTDNESARAAVAAETAEPAGQTPGTSEQNHPARPVADVAPADAKDGASAPSGEAPRAAST